MKRFSIQDLRDVVVGATFLGSGGGGSPESGMIIVDLIAKVKKEVRLVEPKEVADNQYAVSYTHLTLPTNREV